MKKIKQQFLLTGLCFAAIHSVSYAATNVTIDLNTQKYIGGVSQLDRAKYFNIHGTALENQVTAAELNYLVNDLNVVSAKPTLPYKPN